MLYVNTNRKHTVICDIVLDDLVCSGQPTDFYKVLYGLSHKFNLSTFFHVLGNLRFFTVNIHRCDDQRTTIGSDDKLEALGEAPTHRTLLGKIASTLNNLQMSAYQSVNRSTGWIGYNYSLFSTEASSGLQKRMPSIIRSN